MITLLTPTYNRCAFLPALYESLKRQTSKNFEWLIVDDGSEDGTKELVETFCAEENGFKISYVFQQNGGKHTALNTGVNYCESELTAIVDSDDFLLDDAVQTIEENWVKYSMDGSLCGLVFLRQDRDGKVIGQKFPEDAYKSNYIDCRVNMDITGDKFEVFRTEYLKQYRFPVFTSERFMGESVVWGRMAEKYDMIHLNIPLYVCEYHEGGLSESGRKLRMSCPLGGREYAKTFLTDKVRFIKRVKFMLLYIVYSRQAGMTHKAAKKEIKYKFLYELCKIPAFFIRKRWNKE